MQTFLNLYEKYIQDILYISCLTWGKSENLLKDMSEFFNGLKQSPPVSMKPCFAAALCLKQTSVCTVQPCVLSVCVSRCRGKGVPVNTFVSVVRAASLSFQ